MSQKKKEKKSTITNLLNGTKQIQQENTANYKIKKKSPLEKTQSANIISSKLSSETSKHKRSDKKSPKRCKLAENRSFYAIICNGYYTLCYNIGHLSFIE